MEEIAARLFGGEAGDAEDGREDRHENGHQGGPSVHLVDFDPDAEVKLVASMLYPYTELPDALIEDRVRAMGADQRIEIVRVYVGDRTNRRHRPGRAFERPSYRFDVLADYGAFRDLQRHRMLTIEWQPLSPRHGYTRPEAIDLAGLAEDFDDAMERSASLHDALVERFPVQAAYAVSLAYRVRFAMQLNAREAMHLIELRTTPQGHPAYRVVAQEMHRLIGEQAGHRAIAAAMSYADHEVYELERLASERAAAARRGARS